MGLVAAINIGRNGETDEQIGIAVARALHGLVELDAMEIAEADTRGRPLPLLYKCGAKWKRHGSLPGEPHDPNSGVSPWWSASEVIAAKIGDCKDFTAWRVAELKKAGVEARPAVVWTGPKLMHAVVSFPDTQLERWKRAPGSSVSWIAQHVKPLGRMVEDPSRVLGMAWTR